MRTYLQNSTGRNAVGTKYICLFLALVTVCWLICGCEQSPPVAADAGGGKAGVETDLEVGPHADADALSSRQQATEVPAQTTQADVRADDLRTEHKEFLAYAERLKNSANEYYGHEQLEKLKAVDVSQLTGTRLGSYHMQQSWHLLRLGHVDEAVAEVDKAYALLDDSVGRSGKLAILMTRALTYLRLAEVRNCIQRHNCDCCIFPLTGGGVHVDRAPAETARECLLSYLDEAPDNLHVVWILNLLTMALGEYPDGVPEPFRIPASSFESEHDISRFRDVAGELEINTFNLCGGVIVEDFDGDKVLDIVTSSYDPYEPLHYYQRTEDGKFEDKSSVSNLSEQLGGLNCIGADYDNDGDTDILVLRGAWLGELGEMRNSLLQNDGNGNFTDVTSQAGLADAFCPTQAAVWGDFNQDGLLDLYIVNESSGKSANEAQFYPAQLFINQGDGKFVDQARQYGVTNRRFGKGVTAGDYDNDGDLDIYVSNIGPNRLYNNLGNGRFEDVAPRLGLVEPSFRSFATWFFDYNNDGWLDLFVTAYDSTPSNLAKYYLNEPHGATRPRLYRNQGDGTFAEVGKEVGLDIPCLPMGANFGDLDNDGFLDFYLTTGDPLFQTLMPNVMFRNDGGQRFLDVTTSGGFGHLQKGHGVAFADLDNDGDQDIYHQLGGFFPGDKFHNVLFENPGHDNRFIVLKLIGTKSNRRGVGARVKLVVEEDGKAREIHRAVGSVSSFGGSPSRMEIGLGKATAILSASVLWPGSDQAQELAGVELDAMYEVTESAEATKVPFAPTRW